MLETRSDNTPVRAPFSVPPVDWPSSARVVIVGGGIAGASIAYHFARAGWSQIVLLEQNQIASGTTWHSAGQVGQLRSSAAQTKVNRASAELYASLKEETGHDPGWLRCGGMQLATSQERLYQLQRNVALAQFFGVDAEMLSAEECGEYWPGMRTEDLTGGVYLPGDGRVLPGECTKALIRGALQGGVTVVEDARVERLLVEQHRTGRRRFLGVGTQRGDITAEWVVLACNMWMRQLGLAAGVDIPVYPCEHHYLVTRPLPGVDRHCPCTRDPDHGTYFRALDDGGLILGAFQRRSKPWQIADAVPQDFAFGLLDPDWPEFEEPLAAHQHRHPRLQRDDIVKFVNGPEAFTPDNHFVMGRPFETEGLFVAGGWNSAGIACAGGAGKFAVEWMEAGEMTLDLTSVDVLRFLPFQNQRAYLQERVSEVLGLHYAMAWPGRQMETARKQRHLPLHAVHQEQHACFGETSGWERPLFFARGDQPPTIEYSFLRQNWHDTVVAEVQACRTHVALLDQSTFGKLLVRGPDAVSLLQFLCGRNIDIPVQRAIYTGMFHEGGGFQADVTIQRTAEDEFFLITATSQQRHDYDWISRHIGARQVTLDDVTEAWAVLSVMGPGAGKFLRQRLGDARFADDSDYGVMHSIETETSPIRAVRMSYVGELGWEFHLPAAEAKQWHARLVEPAATDNPTPIGNLAISAMRIESGMRAFGHELSPRETPWQAGLAWAVDWEKSFLGKEALAHERAQGPPRQRLVCFALDDPEPVLWGGEPIYWGDTPVGYTTSGCFGPTMGRSVAMGYVRGPDDVAVTSGILREAPLSIEVLGRRWPVRTSLRNCLQATP